jgi:hypothetical protein
MKSSLAKHNEKIYFDFSNKKKDQGNRGHQVLNLKINV